jgi:hypothetical protein
VNPLSVFLAEALPILALCMAIERADLVPQGLRRIGPSFHWVACFFHRAISFGRYNIDSPFARAAHIGIATISRHDSHLCGEMGETLCDRQKSDALKKCVKVGS